MRKVGYFTLLYAAWMLSPTMGVSAEEEPWLILGTGNLKCGAYLEFSNKHDVVAKRQLDLAVFSWASGFFSGLNLFSHAEEVKDLSTQKVRKDALIARIAGRCHENPEQALVSILVKIYGEMSPSEP